MTEDTIWRAAIGENYYRVYFQNGVFETIVVIESNSKPDNAAYEAHNYFKSPEEAQSLMGILQRKLEANLKRGL
jgi:hypothetical protein